MIETSWHSYPKIHALGHAAVADLFKDQNILVQEKVDGSQFSFGVFNGVLRCKSKGKELIIDAPEGMFQYAVDTVVELASKLKDGWTYRAEYLQKPKHNVLAYDRTPAKHLILFDINTAQETYLMPADVQVEAARLGLESVPLLELTEASPEGFAALLETDSVLGGQKIEGIVCKNYARFGRDGKALMGKYVSERFKEVHAKARRPTNPTGKDFIGVLSEKYRTEARWDKAVCHLRERGELTDSPKDIGGLIREAHQDITEECAEEIKQALWDYAKKHIHIAAVRGLPEWYKETLLKTQFEEGDKDEINAEQQEL